MQILVGSPPTNRRLESDEVETDSQRARRFPLPLPLRYRSIGGTQWRDGQVENISRSGVLFRADHLLAVDTPLEISFVLPVGDRPGVVCRGRVVRTVPPSADAAPPGLAATIASYHFLRPA
jgi:PilZ domain